ncbi:MAG: DUF3343 domain-containing protein [Pseudomonadota bacterium]
MLYLFESTHLVIRAEKIGRENKILLKIIPVPRHISSQCGMAIELEPKESERLKIILEREGVPFVLHQNTHD